MFRSILQTAWWAKFKESSGWTAEKYGPLYGLSRQLPFGRSILYFPEIPLDLEHGVPFQGEAVYVSHGDEDKTPKGRIFTRFEFLELWNPDDAKKLVHAGLVKAFEDVQPEYRQWIGLDITEDELLAQMRPKGRYNINLAKKHRLKISWGISDRSIQDLHDLYSQTAARAHFQGRSLAYFKQLAQVLKDNQAGDIVVVSKDGQLLSALLLTFYDGVCSNLYGGSGGDRSLMAPYLAHWQVMLEAKKRGMKLYDLLAIAPFEQSANPEMPIAGHSSHPHAGLTIFKARFGGQSVRLLGSWDLVHRRFWYTLYRFVERRRRKTAQ